MSERSIHDKVRRRVTGPYDESCFVYLVELRTPYTFPDEAYSHYRRRNNRFARYSKQEQLARAEEYREILDDVFWYAGRLSCRDVEFGHANTTIGLKRIVNRLLTEGYEPLVDVIDGRDSHSLGLLPTNQEGYFRLEGNHVPGKLQGIVTLDDIASHLANYGPRLQRFPFFNANITGLPPAA